MAKAPLVVIVGETASGKSALAMQLALKFNGEIIAADSTTVYKGFDIGTAKPSLEDQKLVRHHLLDIKDASIAFTAAEFKDIAIKAVDDITSRGKLPILAGGSGLYIDSVLFDYEFAPRPEESLRTELNGMNIEELIAMARQQHIDTGEIDVRNKRRLMRLIENKGKKPVQKPLRQNTLILGVQLSRDALSKRIAERVQKQFDDGLETEVKTLAQTYGWNVEPMKGVGYREFKDYFSDPASLDEVREQIIIDTLRLAKKQRTWFRRNKSIHWVSEQFEAVEYTTTFLNK
jgi:tRNA dimethylallyltransferase